MTISSPTSVAVFVIAIVIVYKFCIFPLLISPLSKIPSAHPTAPFSSLWSLYIRYVNIENRTLYRIHKAKGPILRLGPNEISVNCYEGLKTVYAGDFDKTDFYPNRFANYGGVTNMLSILGSKEHAARKRLLSNVYSKSHVFTSPTARTTSRSVIYDRFLPIFQSSSETGAAVDVLSLSYAYSIDSFMGFQFGLELGSNFIQNVEEREWYLRNFIGRRPHLFWVLEVPRLYALMKKFDIEVIPRSFFQGIKEMEDWNLKICDEAEKVLTTAGDSTIGVENQPAVFSAMRNAMRKSDLKSGKIDQPGAEKQQYPHRLEIASEMLDHNAASLETSGVILAYVFYELSIRPSLQTRLRNELLTLSPPLIYPSASATPSLPDPKAMDALPLLDAIIQETLRLYAPAPGPQPRVTPYPSCRLLGVDEIPGGVRISANGYSLHRNEEVFPENEKWKPERWMDVEEKKLAEMRKWFWAFGSGARMCIGSHFAIYSLKNAVAAVYSNFTSETVGSLDMELTDGYTAGPKAEKVTIRFDSVGLRDAASIK